MSKRDTIYEVQLSAFPKAKTEAMERVVHKHNRALTHDDHHSVIAKVASGSAQVVGTYHVERAAQNLQRELAYHGATATVQSRPATPNT